MENTTLRHKVYDALRKHLGEDFDNTDENWEYNESIFSAVADVEELDFYLGEVTGGGDTWIQASFLTNRGNDYLTCVFNSDVSFVAQDLDEIVENLLELADESRKARERFNLHNLVA